jgi:hypothetical protein
VPLKILTLDEATELFGFSNDPETRGKTAYFLTDTGAYAYVSGDSDGWVASGRWELAEEFIFAAIRSGKLRLLGRPTSSRPRNSVALETVEISPIDAKTVRERVIDRWDGELVLVSNHDEDKEGYEREEIVDLHILEEDLLALAGDLFAYRGGQDDSDPPVHASPVFGAPVLVQASTPTIGAETECAQWFQAEIPEVPEGGPGKHVMWNDARKKFGSRLSYKAFLRVWDLCAPIEWKRAGRKPRNFGSR